MYYVYFVDGAVGVGSKQAVGSYLSLVGALMAPIDFDLCDDAQGYVVSDGNNMVCYATSEDGSWIYLDPPQPLADFAL